MPRSTSAEKIALIEFYGGRCHFVDARGRRVRRCARHRRRHGRPLHGPVHLRRARHRLARQQQHRREHVHPDAARAPPGAALDRGGRGHGRHQRNHRPLRALPAACHPGVRGRPRRARCSAPTTARATPRSPHRARASKALAAHAWRPASSARWWTAWRKWPTTDSVAAMRALSTLLGRRVGPSTRHQLRRHAAAGAGDAHAGAAGVDPLAAVRRGRALPAHLPRRRTGCSAAWATARPRTGGCRRCWPDGRPPRAAGIRGPGRAGQCCLLLGCSRLALAPRTLAFPRDHGSHPHLRTEWWYITGHAQADERLWGFQITFFRTRVEATQGMQSAFAARQLMFAHAALTDVQGRSPVARPAHRPRRASALPRRWRATRRCACATGRSRAMPAARRAAAATEVRAQAEGFALELGLRQHPARAAAGPGRPVAQGARRGAGQLLLQPAPAGGDGRHHPRGPAAWPVQPLAAPANRAWMDHEWSRGADAPRGRGLGLDRHEPARRRRTHRVPPAARRRQHALDRGILAARRSGPAQCFESAGRGVHPAATLAQPKPAARSTRSNGAWTRPRAALSCVRCWTRRSSTAAAPPAHHGRCGCERRCAPASAARARGDAANRPAPGAGAGGDLEMTGYRAAPAAGLTAQPVAMHA